MVSNTVYSHLSILNHMRFKHSKRNKCMYFYFFFKDLTHGLWTGHFFSHRLVFKLFLCIG